MKKTIITMCATAMMFLSACGTTAKWVYPQKMSALIEISSEPVTKYTVAVIPFEDYRNDDNTSGTIWLAYLPLMPFGWVNYDRPDAARMFMSIYEYDCTPSEDLAKATALSLRKSNFFKDAVFSFGKTGSGVDLILTGKIHKMSYNGKLFTYCLSSYGSIFWLLGAPAGTSNCTMSIEMELRNANGKILWTWTQEKDDYIVQWIYGGMGKDCNLFTKFYQDIMNEAIADLVNRYNANKQLFE